MANLKLRILALAAAVLLAVPAPAMANGPTAVHLTGTLHMTEMDALSGAQPPDGYSLSTDTDEVTLAVTGDARGKAGAKVELTGTQLPSGAGQVSPATASMKKILVVIGNFDVTGYFAP